MDTPQINLRMWFVLKPRSWQDQRRFAIASARATADGRRHRYSLRSNLRRPRSLLRATRLLLPRILRTGSPTTLRPSRPLLRRLGRRLHPIAPHRSSLPSPRTCLAHSSCLPPPVLSSYLRPPCRRAQKLLYRRRSQSLFHFAWPRRICRPPICRRSTWPAPPRRPAIALRSSAAPPSQVPDSHPREILSESPLKSQLLIWGCS